MKKSTTKQTQTKYCETHHMSKELMGEGEFAIPYCPECCKQNNLDKEAKAREVFFHDMQRKEEQLSKHLAVSEIPIRFLDEKFITNDVSKPKIKQAYDFLSNPYSGMIFTGNNKMGKTLLSCNLLRYHIENNRSGFYSVFLDMITKIKDSWNMRTSTSDVINLYCIPDLLVIDELDLAHGSKTENIYFARIIDKRYADWKKTIIISNAKATDIEALTGIKAWRRLIEGGNLIVFNWEAYK